MTQKIFAICSFGLVCLAATGCNQNSQLATDSQAASSATESGNSNNGSRVLDQFMAPCDLNEWTSFMTVPIIEDYLSKKNKKLLSVTPIVPDSGGNNPNSAAPGSCYFTFERNEGLLPTVLSGGEKNAQAEDLSIYIRQFMAPCEIRTELTGAPKEETDMYLSQGFELVAMVPIIGSQNVAQNSCLYTFAKSR
jgi:hypothetical protein